MNRHEDIIIILVTHEVPYHLYIADYFEMRRRGEVQADIITVATIKLIT